MSAVDQLRLSVLAGQADIQAPSAIAGAVLELADRIAAIEAKVFPPQPAAGEPVAIVAEPIATDRPQLTGSVDVQMSEV